MDGTLDLACIETQVQTGLKQSDPRDCELITYDEAAPFGHIAVPALE
jgi:allantoicase